MNSAVVKRLNDKNRHMFSEFADDLTKMMIEYDISDECRTKIKCFVANYQFGSFSDDDLKKRKRNTHVVVTSDRCSAKRSNGEQCTRRHKDGSQYCGTHNKGQPHGKVDESIIGAEMKKEVRAEEIKGIVYYIDDEGNVYDTQQVHQNASNPDVVGKYLNGVLTKYNM
jgi:hypothetical protein